MAGIRALTPTSAGLAQVFDTSQFTDQLRQKKAGRQQELNKTRLNYDPRGLYDQDIPAYQQIMEEYQAFVSDNHNKLLNSSENMEVWRKKVAFENEIKNFIAGSSGKNKGYINYLNKTVDDKKFRNEHNTEFATQAKRGITAAEFREGNLSSWDIGLENLERNIDFTAFKAAQEVLATIGETTQDMKSVNEAFSKGTNLYETATGINYDPELLKNKLTQMYEEESDRGRDLRYQFKEFSEFEEALEPALIRQSSTALQMRSTGKDGTGKAPRGFYAAQPQFGTSVTVLESGVSKTYTEQERKQAKKEGKALPSGKQEVYSSGIATVNKTEATDDKGETMVTTGGKVVRVDGMGITIKMPMSGATNITTGKPITDAESHVYKSGEIQEFGNYWWATKDLVVNLSNGDKLQVESDTNLPDLQDLLKKKLIDQKEIDRIMSYENGFIYPAAGMVMQADPEKMDVLTDTKGAGYREQVAPSEGGKIYTTMKLEGNEAAINSYVADAYPDLAQLYDGDWVGAMMQPLQLDENYFDFYSNKNKSALR